MRNPTRVRVDLWPVTGRAGRWGRPIILGVSGGFLAVWAVEIVIALHWGFPGLAIDFEIYVAAARHWLADGTWYLPRQLAGPYIIQIGDVLYPPTLLWFMVPFTILPAVLWWIIPATVAAIGFARLRPAMWAWPIMAACLAWPRSTAQIVYANPAIWIAAALFWGVGAVALVKPTVIPFALVGIRSRRWWVALAIAAVLTLPFVPLALQYPGVLLDARSGSGWLYSLAEFPLLCIPLVAWWGRKR